MPFSPQSKNSYAEFGFIPDEEEEEEEASTEDYSGFGFLPDAKDIIDGKPVNEAVEEPQKKKAGKGESILNGFIDAFLGVPALVQYGVNEISRPIEEAFYGKEENPPSFEEENPVMNYLGTLNEGEDETARRLRAGTSGVIGGAVGGIPGIVAGLVGSQAGQTIREIYGKEGKFDEFGLGEAAAIGTDLVTGLGAGVGTSLARGARSASQAARVPPVFSEGSSMLQRASIKQSIQGEKNALSSIINDFSSSQINAFERDMSSISPSRYTELTNSNLSGVQRNAQNMQRSGALGLITPIEATTEQGGRAIQQSANQIFQDNVITAERAAYTRARESAKSLSGTAPKTLEQAKTLRNSLITSEPSPEQRPMISYLNTLIEDLENVTPASVTRESRVLGPDGLPVSPSMQIPESSAPAVKRANELIDMVQKGNQAVNYSSEFREQSHRLMPIINTLREETGQVLAKNPTAQRLYGEANTLHARNAETWGTKYMRSVRFSETPEDIISKTQKASNLRNLKLAIPDPTIQNVAERLVVDKITKGGSAASNAKAIREISPELSLNARNAAQELINSKDPLTSSGGRALVRNEILKDAAQAVNTGKRPEKILDLMDTPKGLTLVRETLNQSPQGRQILQSVERQFIEDIFSSIREPSGAIDFSKARTVFKNLGVRQSAEMIGGEGMVRRFDRLEQMSNNLDRNLKLYSNPETQTFLKKAFKDIKGAGVAATFLHAIHVPWPAIAGIGLAKAGAGASKLGYNALQRKLLTNPTAFNILESISRATNKEQLATQIPRLITELSKEESKK